MYNPRIGCSLGSPEIAASIANSYGRAGDAYSYCPYMDISEVFNSRQNCAMYCNTKNVQEYALQFKQYNPNDTNRAYPLFTNRVITASTAPCHVYQQTNRTIKLDRTFVLDYSDGTDGSMIEIPGEYITDGSTQYIYRDSEPPPQASKYVCGPRCITVWAHISGDRGGDATFYECNVTVNPVL